MRSGCVGVVLQVVCMAVYVCLHVHMNVLSPCDQQALHLVKEMDQDGDGAISEAEVLKNQELFMNSEVTDYGRHLYGSHDEL